MARITHTVQRSRWRAGAAVAALALALTACGDDTSTAEPVTPGATASAPGTDSTAGTTASAPETDSTAAAAAPGEVPATLQFSSPVVGGGTFDGASVAGKPAAFWFWAPT